jgi:Rod binding domain-containing protein
MDKVQQNPAAGHVQFTEQQKAKLKSAVKDFEAVFMQYMLKSMQQTEKIDGSDSQEGYGNDIMTSLFNTKLSQYITDNSNLGIGNMLYKQFTGEDMDSQVPGISASDPGIPRQGLTSAQAAALQKIKAYSAGSVLENVGKYSDIINEAASTYDLQPNLIRAVIAAESAGKADSLSSKDAKGLMQLTDPTAKEMGVSNSFDPRENIMGGSKYLKSLIEKYSGDLNMALASYNAGPGTVEQYNGIPPFQETQNYVRRVTSYLNMFDASEVSNGGQ